MYLLDVIGPGDPRFTPTTEPNYVVPAIIISLAIIVVVVVIIVAISLKKKKK